MRHLVGEQVQKVVAGLFTTFVFSDDCCVSDVDNYFVSDLLQSMLAPI